MNFFNVLIKYEDVLNDPELRKMLVADFTYVVPHVSLLGRSHTFTPIEYHSDDDYVLTTQQFKAFLDLLILHEQPDFTLSDEVVTYIKSLKEYHNESL